MSDVIHIHSHISSSSISLSMDPRLASSLRALKFRDSATYSGYLHRCLPGLRVESSYIGSAPILNAFALFSFIHNVFTFILGEFVCLLQSHTLVV